MVCEICGTKGDVQWYQFRQMYMCRKCHARLREIEDKNFKESGDYNTQSALQELQAVS